MNECMSQHVTGFSAGTNGQFRFYGQNGKSNGGDCTSYIKDADGTITITGVLLHGSPDHSGQEVTILFTPKPNNPTEGTVHVRVS